MNSCSCNRELIAGLALETLDARQERELRAHLETCEGCRLYLREISNVTEKLAAVEIRSDIQTSESFHKKMSDRLKAETSVSLLETVMARLRANWLNWRSRKERLLTPDLPMNRLVAAPEKAWIRFAKRASSACSRRQLRFSSWLTARLALPVIFASVLLIAALSLLVQQPDVTSPAPTVPQIAATPNTKTDLDPTISNYQMVANRSLEKLDELLTKQGSRNPSPTPLYTASALARANAFD